MSEKQGRLGVYSIFDIKAQSFMPIFTTANDSTATRNLQQMVTDPSPNMVNKYPDDFSLFRVGSFDDLTGAIHSELPKSIVLASSLKV